MEQVDLRQKYAVTNDGHKVHYLVRKPLKNNVIRLRLFWTSNQLWNLYTETNYEPNCVSSAEMPSHVALPHRSDQAVQAWPSPLGLAFLRCFLHPHPHYF